MRFIVFTLLFIVFKLLSAQSTSPFIVVDQFGYLPEAPKVAIIRKPVKGHDAPSSFNPGSVYELVNAKTGEVILKGNPVKWDNGRSDESSGDQVLWFNFSQVTDLGIFYVRDVENDLRSFKFQISPAVYNEVLKHACRTFFYQRVGYEKSAEFAGEEWADAASHIGPLQDKNCRSYNDPQNASSELDLSGGWYDAGDYNKYTSWTSNYVIDMMKAFEERPDAWTDDYNLPESGNGIPDILDEARWGTDHLLRLQKEDGSMISVIGLSAASPPSSATGQSLYGNPSTSATLNGAAAFAIASKVFKVVDAVYAETLKQAAEDAWSWADQNPKVLFYNNSSAHGTTGLAAGQQETDDYGRAMAKLKAACFLFAATGKNKYRSYFDKNYTEAHLFDWSVAYPFESTIQEVLLYYTTISGASTSISEAIRSKYKSTMDGGSENWPSIFGEKDPYRAHLKNYTWGSNSVKMQKGSMYYNLLSYNVDLTNAQQAKDAAIGYVNYIHGVNPLNMVYLSNMYMYGGENCVNEFYHTWFSNGSAKWDRVGDSSYGPAPGFVVGGANPSYSWDECCPGSCGSGENNTACIGEDLSTIINQPAQKSYKDFNTSWPLNSWEVTENSCGYQISYIRLLSKYVNPEYDCSGIKGGGAKVDKCGRCTGGTTGLTPTEDCNDMLLNRSKKGLGLLLYPNPAGKQITIDGFGSQTGNVKIFDLSGNLRIHQSVQQGMQIDIADLAPGKYVASIAIASSGPEVRSFVHF